MKPTALDTSTAVATEMTANAAATLRRFDALAAPRDLRAIRLPSNGFSKPRAGYGCTNISHVERGRTRCERIVNRRVARRHARYSPDRGERHPNRAMRNWSTPASVSSSTMANSDTTTVTADEFGELFRALRNWGRWGAEDQRGALNHLTPERIAAAAGLVQDGATVTLSLPVNTEAAVHNPKPA